MAHCAALELAPLKCLFYGQRFLDTRNQIEKSNTVIAWGNNPAISKQGYFQRFEKMMENGGKFVVIRPHLHPESAAKASEWIQPCPAPMPRSPCDDQIVIDEDLFDKEFTLAHTCAPCLVDKTTGEPGFAG